MKYVVKQEKLPNNLNIIQFEFKEKTIIYINTNKKTSCANMRSNLKNYTTTKSK